jgi:hypothetical protein
MMPQIDHEHVMTAALQFGHQKTSDGSQAAGY